MPLARYQGTAVNTAGDVIANATVEVRRDQAGRPVVPLFSDREGTVPMGNPIQTDALGQFAFHAPGGVYYIRIFTGPTQSPTFEHVRRYTPIGTAAERDIEDLATILEAGTATFATLAELEAFTPSDEGIGGKVTTGADAGFYHYDDPDWVFDRPLYDTLARMEVTGGTANAIEASIVPGVESSNVVMLWIEALATNTGPVTINAKPVLTTNDEEIPTGQWVEGRTYWFSDEGANYKLRTDSDVSDLVAQAEAAADVAVAAAIAAAEAAAGAGVTDGDKGDVTVGSSGTAWSLNAGSVADNEIAAFNASTSPDAGKIAYRPGWSGSVAKPIIARFANMIHVSEADVAGDAVTDDSAKIEAITDYAASTNNCVLFDAKNYKILSPIVVTPGSWKSFKWQGVPTGNHKTLGLGTTCIVTNGSYHGLVVAHNQDANENFRMEDIGFYNQTADYGNPSAVKVIRGEDNGRYLSGFEFQHIATSGYASSFLFQGMNAIGSPGEALGAGLTYFGNIVFNQCQFYNGGLGIQLSNAVLNLADFYGCLWWDLRSGGFGLYRDGDVGAGNGFGSAIRANLHDAHFENVAGLFRTPPPSDGSTLNVIGDVIRNVFSVTGRFSREYNGGAILPTVGEPFSLGVDTDLHFAGDVDEGMGYGEVAYPYLQPGCRLSSTAPITIIANGGRFISKGTISAPVIRKSLPTGATTTFTIATGEPSATFSIKSYLSLSDGNGGYVEGWHRGDPTTTTTSGKIVESLISGLTVTYGSGASGDVLTVAVDNTTGFTFDGELSIENLSSCSIITRSVL